MNSTTRMFTPPQLARQRWGVSVDKVRALIDSGQLVAVNLATKLGGRPRYRIHITEIERFEKTRQTTAPVPKPRRRRREVVAVKEWF